MILNNTVDHTYMLTYNEREPYRGRICKELIDLGLKQFEVINGINMKDIHIHGDEPDSTTGIKAVYNLYGEQQILKLLRPNLGGVVPKNCASLITHKIAIDDAYKKGYENIMIIEDDLVIDVRAKKNMDTIMQTAPEDRDILKLNWTTNVSLGFKQINQNWFEADTVRSTAWTILNRKAIEHIYNLYSGQVQPSFDLLTNRQCDELKMYVSLRTMGVQHNF